MINNVYRPDYLKRKMRETLDRELLGHINGKKRSILSVEVKKYPAPPKDLDV